MIRTFHKPGSFSLFALMVVGALTGLAHPALAETTASFYLGTSHTANSDVWIRQPSTGSDVIFYNVEWDSQSFKNPLYYGIRVNYFFEERPDLGVGLDFTHDKVYAKTGQVVQVNGTWNGVPVNEAARMDQRVQSFNISHGVNTLALNVYHRWALGNSPFFFGRYQPYVGAGPAYYVLHAENTVNGQNNEGGYKGAGFGYQLLVGLHYRITQTVGVFIEAKYNSGKVEVDTGGGGRGETTLNSSQLLGGLSLAF